MHAVTLAQLEEIPTSPSSRFSVDLHTVDVPELMAGRGDPLVDAYCTGIAIRDFISVVDERRFDEETVVKLFGGPPPDAKLVFGSPDEEGSAKRG